MNRRHALCCTGALAAGLFTGLVGARQTRGLRNPCRAPSAELAAEPIVREAFDGLDASRIVDVHAHLLGTGDAGSGCSIHADLTSWWHPLEVVRRQTILNGACVPPDAVSVDRAYVDRLVALTNDFPAGARWMLYAFDRACDDRGRERADWSTFHVPNAYAAAVAAAHPARFAWVASVHPYREDALERLQLAVARGAVAVKWLPSAMNIDLVDARCNAFYDALVAAGLPLIVHCGEEKAVPGADREAYGNPLQVRAPLARGVRVVVAHAASLGQARDTDRRSQPRRAAFDLWARLMDEPASRGLLHADISAVFQRNREPRVWREVLVRDDWHPRLLNGSDYPLPGVLPLFSPARLAAAGLLDAADVEPLVRIREHNALLFDFVLKRRLRIGGRGLPASVFETAPLFRAASFGPPSPTPLKVAPA